MLQTRLPERITLWLPNGIEKGDMEVPKHNTIAVVKKGFEQSIPDRIEETARKYPDRVAFKRKKLH